METVNAEPLFHVKNELGEGPLWHPLEKQLYWVDINAGDIYQTNAQSSRYTKNHFDTSIGAFGFKSTGGLILATGKGFMGWQEGQEQPEPIWNPLPDRESVRLNDGKVDPAGRFWAGSMDAEQYKGELYRLDPDGSHHTILKNMGCSNGIGWSPDRKTMYVTDSFKYLIYAFDFNLSSGEIKNQRTFIRFPQDDRQIMPDGLCVDAEGYIWSAEWNGWQIVRYDPHGQPIQRVSVPTQQVTSCCFGGVDNDTLFITTARGSLSHTLIAEQPLAGDVFMYQTDTQGQPTNFFGEN